MKRKSYGRTMYFDHRHRIIDIGFENEDKANFAKWLDRMSNILLVISNNIAILVTARDLDSENKRIEEGKLNTSLQTLFFYNTWGMVIIQLSAIISNPKLATDNSLTITKLVDFAEKNQDNLFTKVRQEAKIPEGIIVSDEDAEWVNEPVKSASEVLLNCKIKLNLISDDIDMLRKIRNKVYAHNTFAYSGDAERQELYRMLNLDLVVKVLNATTQIFNDLYNLYWLKTMSFETTLSVIGIKQLFQSEYRD